MQVQPEETERRGKGIFPKTGAIANRSPEIHQWMCAGPITSTESPDEGSALVGYKQSSTIASRAGGTRATMRTSSIAKKAHSKAKADFATWLMMAKLGSFDDLPPNAQAFLTNYRNRLGTMSETESTALAVREVYSAYYSEMGGVGAAPEPKAPTTPPTNGKAVRFRTRPQPGQSATRPSITPTTRKTFQALLIFAIMVALIVAYRFLTQ